MATVTIRYTSRNNSLQTAGKLSNKACRLPRQRARSLARSADGLLNEIESGERRLSSGLTRNGHTDAEFLLILVELLAALRVCDVTEMI
jgi:hypothetical protein